MKGWLGASPGGHCSAFSLCLVYVLYNAYSTALYFLQTILLGHDDGYAGDRAMTVTVMLNYFGKNLVQRLPRCRFGRFHVLNNYYPHGWGDYAVGGSAGPTILSEGNYYVAGKKKEVSHCTLTLIATVTPQYCTMQ